MPEREYVCVFGFEMLLNDKLIIPHLYNLTNPYSFTLKLLCFGFAREREYVCVFGFEMLLNCILKREGFIR